METFITLIDDSDVDVKMIADECLNRVIRVRSFFSLDILKLLCCVDNYGNLRFISYLQ